MEALQENAGDPCMELFASAVPHFPLQKTPMGLPLASIPPHSASSSSSSPTSLGTLRERYSMYSSAQPSPEFLGSGERTEPHGRHSSPSSSSYHMSRGITTEAFCLPLKAFATYVKTDLCNAHIFPLILPPTNHTLEQHVLFNLCVHM